MTLNPKIKSSSLIEVIVAMLIASIVFYFTFLIILNVTKASKTISKSYCRILANSTINQLLDDVNSGCFRDSIEIDNLMLYRTVALCQDLPNLELLEVKIKDASGNVKYDAKLIRRAHEN